MNISRLDLIIMWQYVMYMYICSTQYNFLSYFDRLFISSNELTSRPSLTQFYGILSKLKLGRGCGGWDLGWFNSLTDGQFLFLWRWLALAWHQVKLITRIRSGWVTQHHSVGLGNEKTCAFLSMFKSPIYWVVLACLSPFL